MQYRLALHALGVCQADGTLIRDSAHLQERSAALKPFSRARLEKALDTYESFQSGKTPFRIAVVGGQGIGKSHFVNNFLQAHGPILPSKMGGQAVTSSPAVLTFGASWGLSVVPTQLQEGLPEVSSRESLVQAFQMLLKRQEELAARTGRSLTAIRGDLKRLAEHQEKVDNGEEKLRRAKVDKSKKKLKAELEELKRTQPKSLDLDSQRGENPEMLLIERIIIRAPLEYLKGVEIIDCPGYADKDSDARNVKPILRDAHCLAVVAARLPSRLEYDEALERDCMASSLLVVWRWPDEGDEVRKKGLSEAPSIMEQAYRKRFLEERCVPFQAEQLVLCSSVASFLTEFDSPKLDWIGQARDHHLEKLAEWLLTCLVEKPLPIAVDHNSLLSSLRPIIPNVVSYFDPTRLYCLQLTRFKLVDLIIENISRAARDSARGFLARCIWSGFRLATDTKQVALQISMTLDAVQCPPLPPDLRVILHEEMRKIWPANVIQSIAVAREQTNREKYPTARLEAEALCGQYSNIVEAAMRDWFSSLVKQAADCLLVQ